MAIRPASTKNCTRNCRCSHGVNARQAYDCKQPCEKGFTFVKAACDCAPPGVPSASVTVSISSFVGLKKGLAQEVQSFIVASGIVPGSPMVIDDEGAVLGWNGQEMIEVGRSPYRVGDSFGDTKITYVASTIEASPVSNAVGVLVAIVDGEERVKSHEARQIVEGPDYVKGESVVVYQDEFGKERTVRAKGPEASISWAIKY